MSQDDDAHVDKIPPRRAAARKASKLAAEQLESSPIQSDREGESWPFGEPTKGKGAVKFTYGMKGKSRSSPPKVRSPVRQESPTRPRPRPRPRKSAVPTPVTVVLQSTPGPSLPSAKSRRQSIPPRSRSSTAGDSLTPLTSDSDSGYEAPVSVPLTDHKIRRIPTRRATINSQNVKGSVARRTLALPSTPEPPVRSAAGRKRSRSISPPKLPSPDFDDTGSILTPLSSPGPEDVAGSHRSMSRPRSVLGRSASFSAAPLSDVSHARSRPDVLKRMMHQRSKNIDNNSDTALEVDADWALDSLGTYVWVRIDTTGDVVEDDDSDAAADSLWWPAKVIDPRIPLGISLFGQSPGSAEGQDAVELTVLSPSATNILSMAPDGRIRFTEATYRVPGRALSMQESPRKRPKVDLETRWKAARVLMLKADEDDNDGLPMMLSDYIGRDILPTSRGRRPASIDVKGKGKASEPPSLSTWRAPSCDPFYEVPGELVLAKEKKTYTDYWPAKLVEYVKPTEPRQKPRYRVAFYDGMVKLLTKDMFYATTEKGFKTCKLGQDSLNYRLDEEADDSALDSTNLEQDNEKVLRAPSPPPALPAPDTFEFEPLPTQFAYITPVLAAVIVGGYEPANERHDAFMRGAKARQKVCESAPVRGSLLQREVEELLRLVRQWAHRRMRREELGIAVDPAWMRVDVGAQELGDNRADNRAEGGSEIPSTEDASVFGQLHGAPSSPNTEQALSEVDCPPSSFVAPTEAEEECDLDHNFPRIVPDGYLGTEQYVPAATEMDHSERALPGASEDVDMAAPLSPPDDGDSPSSDGAERPRPSITFKDLLPIDQITYCTSVLLREAVLQLLLWRSGMRSIPTLLPPGEERRLHAVALEKSEETWWVHDIVFLKRAAEGTMLPPNQAEGSKNTSTMTGGTRSRPRRG